MACPQCCVLTMLEKISDFLPNGAQSSNDFQRIKLAPTFDTAICIQAQTAMYVFAAFVVWTEAIQM